MVSLANRAWLINIDYPRFSLLIALLNWIGESPSQKNSASNPGYLSFGMACTYISSCTLTFANTRMLVLAVGVVRKPSPCLMILKR